ncbi:MAG: hypothetical protein ACXADB_14785 [Candidatus Hermodarchaeia archaeon]|jgi:hypothetical protein
MSDPMTRLTKATMDMKKFTDIMNYWTVLIIVIQLLVVFTNALFPLLLVETIWLTIGGSVFLVLLILLWVAVILIKDTQLRILFNLIRAIVVALAPLILLATFGPYNLWFKIAAIILFLCGLIILYFNLKPVLTMNAITKELVKGSKS